MKPATRYETAAHPSPSFQRWELRRTLPDMLSYPAIEQAVVDGEVVSQNDSVEPDLGEPEPDLEDMGPPGWRESGTFGGRRDAAR
jgi:hypothetical protein